MFQSVCAAISLVGVAAIGGLGLAIVAVGFGMIVYGVSSREVFA